MIREFKEELGIDLQTVGEPIFFENLFTHEGSAGHGFLILYEVVFPLQAFDGRDRILFYEDSGEAAIASWFDLNELDIEGGPALYPAGLKPLLLGATVKDVPCLIPRLMGATSLVGQKADMRLSSSIPFQRLHEVGNRRAVQLRRMVVIGLIDEILSIGDLRNESSRAVGPI